MRPDRSSATARVIAASIVLADHDTSITPRPDPAQADWSERLLAADPAAAMLLACVRRPAGRRALRLAERLLLPGIVGHYLYRKQWLAAAWNRAHQEGFRQLIVLGAGYDTLSLRIAASESPVRIAEIDHPATQRARRRVVESAGFRRPPQLVASDLAAAPLATTMAPLFAEYLQPGADLFVQAEGLLMYFDASRVETMLRDLASLPCPRVRLAFTYMEHPRAGRPSFRPQSPLVRLWLALRGEPFRSGIESDALHQQLADLGWSLQAHDSRPGRPPGTAGPLGESAAVAER